MTNSANYYSTPKCVGYELEVINMRCFGKLEVVQDLSLPYVIIPNLL